MKLYTGATFALLLLSCACGGSVEPDRRAQCKPGYVVECEAVGYYSACVDGLLIDRACEPDSGVAVCDFTDQCSKEHVAR